MEGDRDLDPEALEQLGAQLLRIARRHTSATGKIRAVVEVTCDRVMTLVRAVAAASTPSARRKSSRASGGF